jgi:hypothetical protein
VIIFWTVLKTFKNLVYHVINFKIRIKSLVSLLFCRFFRLLFFYLFLFFFLLLFIIYCFYASLAWLRLRLTMSRIFKDIRIVKKIMFKSTGWRSIGSWLEPVLLLYSPSLLPSFSRREEKRVRNKQLSYI